MNTDKLYFWFSREDKRLRFGDERLAKTGITHSVRGELRPCRNGLHASETIIDALGLSTGCYLWLVSLSDEKVAGTSKVCARSRTYKAGFNAEKMIKAFTRKQALINIELIKPFCNPRLYDLTVEWLQTGKEELRFEAERTSNCVVLATSDTTADKHVRSAAYGIRCSTLDRVTDVYGFAQATVYSKERSKNFKKAYAQANKALMDMLPNRIKTILAQHEQGDPK